MTPEYENQPSFGQRSGQVPAQGGAQGHPGSTPWPQYGSVQGGPHTAPQAPQYPQAGYSPVPPGGQGYQYAPAPIGDLPGRGGPIALIVFGVLMAIIVAPVVTVMLMLSGLDFPSMMEDLKPVESGDVVTVDQSGTFLVASESPTVKSCSLESPTKTIQMQSQGTSGFLATNLEPGRYTLTCEGAGSAQLFGVTGMSVDSMTDAGVSGLTWGTVVGVLGLAMIIGGIVWLVMVNGKRRRLMGK